MTSFVFDLDGYCQRECLESFFDICAMPLDHSKMHDLVRSYLVHYAFVETLQAYEEEDRPVPKGCVVFPGLSDT